MKRTIIFFELLLFLTPLMASENSESGGHILLLNSASRAEALSGAVTARGGDISFYQQNPASISGQNSKEILFTQGILFEGVRSSYLVYSQPMRYGIFAFDGLVLNYGKFDRTDMNRETVGTQSPNDLYIGMGWSPNKDILSFDHLDMAISARYIRSNLVLREAQTVAFGIGAIFHSPWEGVRFGGSLNHLGPPLKYEETSNPLPRTLRLGVVYDTDIPFFPSNIFYSFDTLFINSMSPKFSAGADLKIYKLLNFQMGISRDELSVVQFRYGFGIGTDLLEVHYAMTPLDSLGTGHSLSLKYAFGMGILNLFGPRVKAKGVSEEAFLTGVDIEESIVWRASLGPQSNVAGDSSRDTHLIPKQFKGVSSRLKRNYGLACEYMESQKIDLALEHFRKVYSENNSYKDSVQKYLVCLESQSVQFYMNRRYGEALLYVQEGLKIDPKNGKFMEFLKDIEAMAQTSRNRAE